MRWGNLHWFWLTALVVALDQLSKFAAIRWLILNQEWPVLPGFSLTLVYNTGAAFSFLRDAGGWQRYLLSALAVVISTVLVCWLARLPAGRRRLAAALALVIGGAVGNLWDRLHYGYVIDFLHVYYDKWSWPVFNLADSAITLGACLLLIDAAVRRD